MSWGKIDQIWSPGMIHRNTKFSNGKEIIELNMKIIEQWNRLSLKMCLKKCLSCQLWLHLKEVSFNLGGSWLLYFWFKHRYRCECSKWLELNIVSCYFPAKWFNGELFWKFLKTWVASFQTTNKFCNYKIFCKFCVLFASVTQNKQ